MHAHVERRTVDLSGYPDLVVIYPGMRVSRMTGLKTLVWGWAASLCADGSS